VNTRSSTRFSIDSLSFYTWHEAPVCARSQLRKWVWEMRRARDGERGGPSGGAGSWLDEKVALSRPGSLFQTFLALHQNEVVWTGSVVQDDRGCSVKFAAMGYPVDAFFGLFNTRPDMRCRGIGWTGANYVSRYVWGGGHGWETVAVGLFTANPAAERHYIALGFDLIGEVFIPEFGISERAYVKRGRKP
jgi:hypothetical protein